EQGRLGVQRVVDGLDQHQVGAAVDETAQGVSVGRDQRLEAHVAKPGVVHVGRDRGGLGGGPERTSDEARSGTVALLIFVRGVAREARGGVVELVGELLHAVVAQRYRGRI